MPKLPLFGIGRQRELQVDDRADGGGVGEGFRICAPDGTGVHRRGEDAGARSQQRFGFLHVSRAGDDCSQQIMLVMLTAAAEVDRQSRQEREPRAAADGDGAGKVTSLHGSL